MLYLSLSHHAAKMVKGLGTSQPSGPMSSHPFPQITGTFPTFLILCTLFELPFEGLSLSLLFHSPNQHVSLPWFCLTGWTNKCHNFRWNMNAILMEKCQAARLYSPHHCIILCIHLMNERLPCLAPSTSFRMWAPCKSLPVANPLMPP